MDKCQGTPKMKHYIIVKWNNTVSDKVSIAVKIRNLYAAAVEIPGVEHVVIHENITQRDNRYDLMIIMDMENEGLQNWDDSILHKQWKTEYGPLIDNKAIFDSASGGKL